MTPEQRKYGWGRVAKRTEEKRESRMGDDNDSKGIAGIQGDEEKTTVLLDTRHEWGRANVVGMSIANGQAVLHGKGREPGEA